MEDLIPLHLAEAGQDVPHGVVLQVAHVQVPGGVGEHDQYVLLPLPSRDLLGLHEALFLPEALPLGLYGVRVVLLHALLPQKNPSPKGKGRPGPFPP